MAFVIVSRRNLTSSKSRTINLEFFVGLVALTLLMVLGLGLFLGSRLQRSAHVPGVVVDATEAAHASPTPQPALLEQIGELAARMVQLELETKTLTERLSNAQELERRMQMDQDVPLGPLAKTQPGSGGPLLEALPAPTDIKSSAPTPRAALMQIERHIEHVAQRLTDLDQHAAKVNLAHMAFPGRPPVIKAIRTSRFGNRSDPFIKRAAFHSGVDFAAPAGTPIQASAGGKVIFSGTLGAYGKAVEVDHGAGLVTRYAHLSKLLVKKDQIVTPGQLIAKMGSTGRSTGPHLHFEIIKDGHFVNPDIYLKRFKDVL